MPQIKSVNLKNGIQIIGSGINPSFELLWNDFPQNSNILILEEQLNNLLQSRYEIWTKLRNLPKDDRWLDKPNPTLRFNERISDDKKWGIITTMYTKVKLLNNPPINRSDIDLTCSDKPITEE